jgi:hypothetical protein
LTGKKARIAEKIVRKTGANMVIPQKLDPVVPAAPAVEETKSEE